MPSLNQTEGKAYWRSLNDLADTEEFRDMVRNEFPEQLETVLDPVSRRRFVQLMGASLALAGLTGCDIMRWPEQSILPYSRLPDERLPGTPVHYATTMELGGVGAGLLVRSYDGRPIKVEGNELHPASRGATSGHAQAHLLALYDPDRSQSVRKKKQEKASDWAAFSRELAGQLTKAAADNGAKVAILSEATSSPTVAHLRAKLSKAYPRMTWWEWEPLSRENELSGASQEFLGGRYRVQCDLTKADVILSLDEDLFGAHPDSLRLAREWADRRRKVDAGQASNRLYVVESTFTTTGSSADVRASLQAGQILHFGLHLAAELVHNSSHKIVTSDELKKRLKTFVPKDSPTAPLVAQIAKDLLAARGASAITVGARQPSELHALAHLLNGLLGNEGSVVTYTKAPEAGAGDLTKLREEINAKKIDTLIVIGTNPAYTAPANLDFAKAIEQVGWSAHLGLYQDETGSLTTWHLPRAHYLESWSDARSYDGTVTMGQPLIAPLFGGKSASELLGMILEPTNAKVNGYELMRAAHQKLGKLGANFERGWRKALHDGLVIHSADAAETWKTGAHTGKLLAKLQALPTQPKAASATGLELVFTPCAKLYDGRFANNGWLQELPDPFSKLTWDNAVLLSPETAEACGGIKEGDLVQLTAKVAGASKTLNVAAFVLPGLAPFTLNLALGYGRAACGAVGKGTGFNSYELRGVGGMDQVGGVTLAKIGRYELATTQDHHSIRTEVSDAERDIRAGILVREGTLSEYHAKPKFARNVWEGGNFGAGPNPATTLLWNEPQKFEGRKWGMAIDLNVCTGCSACVVACQSENNIPIVGKSEVQRGREMHWLRIDRYFAVQPLGLHAGGHGKKDHEEEGSEKKGTPGRPAFLDAVRVVHQPMPCQQCENAPCEQVCPVAATTHSDEGLNDMVYNRCIGTRYCSNNCPWKVRRFNYFWNHHGPFHPRSEPGPATLPKLPPSKITETLKFLPTAAAASKLEHMAMNPEVTVRARGVMEKCTYCVQRIKAVTVPARNAAVQAGEKSYKVEDGAIRTACQQVCPTQAITFGDLSDPHSEVSMLREGNRSYTQLPELNARPRTSYMALIRNLPIV
jgi:MoCo/4Fe-4S cofactor protein with predicted Tat translocation signal